MVHCPNCEATLADESDVEFDDVDSSIGFLKASKRFYVARCADCGTTIGTGVAGKSASGGGAAAGGAH